MTYNRIPLDRLINREGVEHLQSGVPGGPSHLDGCFVRREGILGDSDGSEDGTRKKHFLLRVRVVVGGFRRSVRGLLGVARSSPMETLAIGVDFIHFFIAGVGRCATLADASVSIEVEEGMGLLGVSDCLGEHGRFVVHVDIAVELDPYEVVITVILGLGSEVLGDFFIIFVGVGLFADAAGRGDSDARLVAIEVFVIEIGVFGDRWVGERRWFDDGGREGWKFLSSSRVAEAGCDNGCG